MEIFALLTFSPVFHWTTLTVLGVAIVCMVLLTFWLIANRYGIRPILGAWALFVLLLFAGISRVVHEESAYKRIWKEVLLGITRVFVSATEQMGHAEIVRSTTPNDPVYKNLLELHTAWCRDMPMVAYVFTLRLRENESEKVDWIVSCPSDLNRDGKIEGPLEVGEGLYTPYDEWYEIYGKGFAGEVVIDDHVCSEEYGGYYVTAVAPLRDANGSIEAIFGVDFRMDFWERMLGQVRSASALVLGMLLSLYLIGIWSIALLHRSVTRLARTNMELIAAKKEADVAAKAKSDFLANMSHEIRTPMNALLGFTEILVQRVEQSGTREEREESQGILDIIRKSGKDLLSIINDILDFSRIEANLLQIESVPVSIKQLLEEIWQLEMPNVVAKHLDFSIKYKEPVPEMILADPARLRQVLINLIGNAIKFTEKGSVTVQCETLSPLRPATTLNDTERSSGGSSITRDPRDAYPESVILRIDVIDTGIGIDPKHMEKLFKPFSQIDTSSTRQFGGTGLGLGIAKRLAELMDGDITATSKLHVGSTFTLQLHVYLPTEAQSSVVMEESAIRKKRREHAVATSHGSGARKAGRENAPDNRTAPTPGGSRPLAHARILLVEDMAVNQIVISTQLKDAGATVETVGNGELGVQKITRDADDGLFFDVVLMDMQMPVMDGYEAAKLLRSQGYNRPIIAITAHALTGDRERTIDAGCDDYIAKPVDRQILIDTIKKYI